MDWFVIAIVSCCKLSQLLWNDVDETSTNSCSHCRHTLSNVSSDGVNELLNIALCWNSWNELLVVVCSKSNISPDDWVISLLEEIIEALSAINWSWKSSVASAGCAWGVLKTIGSSSNTIKPGVNETLLLFSSSLQIEVVLVSDSCVSAQSSFNSSRSVLWRESICCSNGST